MVEDTPLGWNEAARPRAIGFVVSDKPRRAKQRKSQKPPVSLNLEDPPRRPLHRVVRNPVVETSPEDRAFDEERPRLRVGANLLQQDLKMIRPVDLIPIDEEIEIEALLETGLHS